jgi:uncharacterized protein involved in exopolysaccharide biosynthesis
MNVRTPYQGFPPTVPPPPPAEPSPRERIARLLVLGRRAFGYWRIASLILVVGCALAVFAGMRVKLIYKSEATILFKPAIRTSDRADEESPGDRAQRIGAKLKDVLMTRTRLEGVIKQYDLYPKIVESRGIIEAVGEMSDHVGFRARDSETYVISFENEVPDTAQGVTKSLADSMISEFTKSSLSAAQQEADFLGAQEKRSADELQNANKALATFLTLHPEFAVEAKTTAFGPGTTSPMQPAMPAMANAPAANPLAMGDPQLGVLYRQKARLEAELRNNGASVPAAPGAPAGADAIAKLTIQRDDAAKNAAAAAADLADKRTRLTDEHPDVISAKLAADTAARALHQAEVQLAAARASGGAPSEGDDDANTKRRIAQLNGEIGARQDALKRAQATSAGDAASPAAAIAETSELVQLETEWQRLLSTLKDTRVEHEDLKQKLERAKLQSNAAESAGGDRMLVLDPAYLPMHPSKGGRTKVALMGGVLSVIFALVYAFGRVFFNDTIIDSADIEAMRLVPVLGVLPKVRPSGTTAEPGTSKAVTRAV